MTLEEGILFKIKALFKRYVRSSTHGQCVRDQVKGKILTRNVPCSLNVDCPSGRGDVSKGTQLPLPEALSRLPRR